MSLKISIIALLLSLCLAGPVYAAQTALLINSESGDYIGGGQQNVWTDAELDFTVSRTPDGRAVDLSINNFSRPFSGSYNWWYADFAAPQGSELTVGAYENATRYPFQDPSVPGLSFDGNGAGCNTLTGRFDVLELEFDPNTNQVVRLAIDFEQHCEGNTAALYGSIRVNSDVLLPSLLTAKITLSNPLNNQGCVEATGPNGAVVSLTGSSDADVDFAWSSSTGAVGSDPTFSLPIAVGQSGTVTLTVRDKSTGDQRTKTLHVCVSDTTPPTVTILSPVNGSTVLLGKLQVRIRDVVDTKIAQYRLFIGDTSDVPLGTSGVSTVPIFLPVGRDPVATQITVEAHDASGNVGSSSVTVYRKSLGN
jgi:hypothetical protein